jgi:fatty acid desaturase
MSNVDKWFGPTASVLVVAAIATLTFYMGQQVEKGFFPWWPYPAFALLVITIFTTYGFLTRERDLQCSANTNSSL